MARPRFQSRDDRTPLRCLPSLCKVVATHYGAITISTGIPVAVAVFTRVLTTSLLRTRADIDQLISKLDRLAVDTLNTADQHMAAWAAFALDGRPLSPASKQ